MNLPIKQNDSNAKVYSYALLAALIFGGIYVFNIIAPHIVQFLKYTWLIVALGTPLALITLYWITNPLVVWGFFRTLSWNITKLIIKQDKLAAMDRYADYLTNKLLNLRQILNNVKAKRISIEREIDRLQTNIESNKSKGLKAQEMGDNITASTCGTAISVDMKSIEIFTPMRTKFIKQEEFLSELSDNWEPEIKNLRYTIDAKRREYEVMKEMAKAAGEAEEFLSGNTEAAKLYNESLRQLEEDLTKKIATIDDFERRAQPVLNGMKVDKAVKMDEGLKILDELRKTNNLKLNFSKIPAQQLNMTEVKPNRYTFK